MAVEVGMGYVSVVPEVQGFAAELQQQVTGPADAAGQNAGQQAGTGFSGAMGGALKGGLAAVGAAAVAVLVGGFTKALDQSAIPGKIQAQLGSTPKEAERYGKVAGDLYAHGITDSVQDAAAAVASVMRSGILPPDATNKQIDAITAKVSNLSSTFELDLGQTANAVGQMLKTGIAEDGTEALDLMTVAMQKMGPRADDLSDTMNEYSTKFRDLGLSGADAMGLMAQGMAAGARDTDTVADALKEFQIRATDGSKASKEAYEAIGLSAEGMTKKIAGGGAGAREGLQQVLDGIKAIKDPAERNAVAVGLFGTKAEDLGEALFAMDPSTAVKALGDTAGAAGKMGDALHSGAGAKLEMFKRQTEMAVVNFMGNHVIPALMSAGSATREFFAPAFRVAGEAARTLMGAFSNSGALSGFGSTAASVGGVLRTDLAPGVRGIINEFQSRFIPALSGMWSVVSGQVLPALGGLASTVGGAVSSTLSGLGQILLETVWPAAMRIHSAFSENVKPVLAELSNFISERVSPAVQMIGSRLAELVQKSQPVISVVTTIITWLGRLAAGILGAVIPVVIRLAGPIFSALFSALGTAIRWIGNTIGFIGALGQAFIGAVRWVADFGTNSRKKLGEFTDWMRGLPGTISRNLGDFGKLLVGQGADLARGIWEGINGMGRWLRDKLISWAKSAIPGPIADALGINSPSTLLRDEVGRWLPPGVIEGVDDAQPALDARLRAMVTVPDIRPARAPGILRAPAGTGVRDPGLTALLKALEDDRGREIVVRVGETEIARAVAGGNRQLARR
ncbi:phage tail tape measure protein [Streptomyces sp. NPDC020875]|uniref:phage tail tape measure protein n=1 Tax=Streptomyces sp. NPDC020875 TaxID=3154898 RepID=UPI0033FDFEF0